VFYNLIGLCYNSVLMPIENPIPSDGLRNAGFYREPDKIIVMGYARLELPTKIYDELILNGQSPSDAAVSVIKTGILADRGILVQPIGGEELIVTVNDAAEIPFPTRLNTQTKLAEVDTKPTIHLAENASRLIAQTSKLFPSNVATSAQVTSERLNQWFIKALSLWQRYEGTDLMYFRIDKNTIKNLSVEGLGETWESLGFPQAMVESIGKGSLSTKTLYFKEIPKAIDLLPVHD